MRVLVTGASGHVGGAIARHIAAQGHVVCGLSRRTDETLPPAIAQVAGDIAEMSPDDLERHVPRCEGIVHAAACMDPANDAGLIATNVGGTQALCQLARRWHAQAFVYLSGVSVVGRPPAAPITEATPAAPQSLYVATKYFGEHLAALLDDVMPVLSLRVPSPIGPGLGARRIVGLFIERALRGEPLVLHGQGGRRQNYLDVRDIAEAVGLALARPCRGVVQIGAERAVSNRELAECTVRTLGSASPVEFSGQPDPDEESAWEMDCARARDWLGWSPQYSLEASIAAMSREIAGTAAKKG